MGVNYSIIEGEHPENRWRRVNSEYTSLYSSIFSNFSVSEKRKDKELLDEEYIMIHDYRSSKMRRDLAYCAIGGAMFLAQLFVLPSIKQSQGSETKSIDNVVQEHVIKR